MKKRTLSIIILVQTIFISLIVGIFSFVKNKADYTYANAISNEAETLTEEPPTTLDELKSASDEQLNYWADNLEAYDGRDYNIVTPARNQAKKNICWVYSAIGAVETNILRNGIDNTATKDSLNFDEVVTAYARYFRDGDEDPLGLTANDRYSSESWNVGGNALDAFSIMSQGYCLVDNDATLGPYTSLDTIKSKLATSKYYIKDYMFIENNKNAIKRAIMKYGSVTINYKQPAQKTYIFEEDKTINHSSLIVGWDDTIDKDLFYPNKPAENGAWIVKNSWGDYGNNVVDGVSCFYFSYESNMNNNIFATNVAMRDDYQNIYFYDGKLTDKTPIESVEAQASVYQAKLSTAAKKEQLKAVMIATPQNELNANIKIYKKAKANPENITAELNTLDGNDPIAEVNAQFGGRGMHTINLTTPIDIAKDEYCYVIVRLKDKNQNPVAVTCAEDDAVSTNDMTYYLSGGKWTSHKTEDMSARIRLITNLADKTPNDINSINVTLETDICVYDGIEKKPNVIATDGANNLTKGIDFDIEYLNNICAGQATIIVKGINNYTGAKTLYFTIQKAKRQSFKVLQQGWTYGDEITPEPSFSGENETANVTYTYSNARDGIYADIKPTNAGVYWIKAEIAASRNYESAVAKAEFTVFPKEVEKLNVILEDSAFVYDGTLKTPKVIANDGALPLSIGADYDVQYQNNKYSGQGKAVVAFKNNYSGSKELPFTILQAEKPNVETTIHADINAVILSDIPLPYGFVWKDGNTEINGSVMTAKAVYTGEDASCYKTTELDFEIIIEGERQNTTDNSKQGSLIWLAIVIPAAVLTVAFIAFATAVHLRKR